MLPMLPFVAGIVTGAAALKLWRSKTAKRTPDQVQGSLRQTAVTEQPVVEPSTPSVRQVGSQAAAEPKPARTAAPRKRRTSKAAQVTDEVQG